MAMTALERKPYRPPEPQVEWLVSAEPVPYAEAVLAMDAARCRHRRRRGARMRVAAGAPSIYTAGTSADPSRAARARAISRSSGPDAAAASPITARASAWPM